MAKRNTWIIDGHNVIFAVPELERLQDSDRRRDARERLVEACLAFAAGRQEKVVVFFDGVPGFTQGTRDTTLLEVAFAQYEGKADDMIVLRSDRLIHGGARVTVVTDDQELRGRLHKNAAAVDSRAFWQMTKPKRKPTGEDMPRIPLKDVEEFFLSRENEVLENLSPAPKVMRKKRKNPVEKPEKKKAPTPPPRPPAKRQSPELSAEEKLRLKKERGRRKQERRLRRRKGRR